MQFQLFYSFQRVCMFFVFHVCCKFVFWFQRHIWNPLHNYFKYIEPEPAEMNWVNTYDLSTNYSLITSFTKPVLKKHLHFHDINEPFTDLLINQHGKFIKAKTPGERLFVAKENENYLIRSSTTSNDECIVAMPIRSEIDFIFVEYRHAEMMQDIELVIPVGYYLEGNELFTPAFVARLLELQSSYYTFDGTYTLRIIDHDIKSIIIDETKHIVIRKSDYLVKPFYDTKEEKDDETVLGEMDEFRSTW